MEAARARVEANRAKPGSRMAGAQVLQRLMLHSRHREGFTTFTVGLRPISGSMGIGLDSDNCVSEIYRGGAAEVDGRLQVGDALIAIDGVDITQGVSLVEVIDPQRNPHQLVVARRKRATVVAGTTPTVVAGTTSDAVAPGMVVVDAVTVPGTAVP